MKSSIRLKINLIICGLVLVSTIGLGVISYRIASNAIIDNVNKEMVTLAEQSSTIVQEFLEGKWATMETLAMNDIIRDPSIPMEKKFFVLDEEAKRVGAMNIILADKDGNAIAPDGKSIIVVSEREYFKKAMKGERAVSDPMPNKADPSTMIVMYAAPIKWKNEIVGVLMKAENAGDLSIITDRIKIGETGMAYMINNKGTTIAHANRDAVLKQDNIIEMAKEDKSLTQMAKLLEKMTTGATGYGDYTYNKVKKYIGYAPVINTNWSLAVSIPEEEILSGLVVLKKYTFILIAVFLILCLSIGVWLSGLISKPIMNISAILDKMSSGDFTMTISDADLKNNDETGTLAKSLLTLQNSIKDLIQTIKDETIAVSNNAYIQKQSTSDLLDDIQDISATTEELSAGSEETAASTQEMNASASEINFAINTMVQTTQDGSKTAEEINARAVVMKKNALESRDTADQIYKSAEKALKEAIDKSHEVNKIKAMTDAIMQITSQTNLLALNASIEAARAGEAGKGFSVVADEIRTLAENSKRSTAEIQRVTQIVIASVEDLSSESLKILDFINNKVMDDYETLINISEQYNKDSSLVDNIVSELNSKMKEIYSTMQSMINAINEISTATGEAAEGTGLIAEKTSTITDKASKVLNQSKQTNASSDKLLSAVEFFKI